MLLAHILKDARGFKSSDALHLIEGLTQMLIPTDQVMLFPNCNSLLPNATAYQGTLMLLKSMKAGDRNTLIGELFEGLENGTEALMRLLRHIVMDGEDGDVVQLLTRLAGMMIGEGDGGKQDVLLLQLAGSLMKTAIKRGQRRGGKGKFSAGNVLGQLFEHLPSEVEHIMHHESHQRRTSKGIRLQHEDENAAAAAAAKGAAAKGAAAKGGRGDGGGGAAAEAVFGGVGGLSTQGGTLRPNTDGTTVECQTEDPEGLFTGSLRDAANRSLGSSGSGILGRENLDKIALTHWYKDLLALGNKRRYANIAPMNFSKAQGLVYDTYVRKITKNTVDDRQGKTRESMGSFLRNSFKKLYGIPRVVNENLVGVMRSLELFAGRSRRVRIFGELCGRNQKEHISDRLSDVYLNILTLTWPKFSKAIMRGKAEGDCFIDSTQIRRVLMHVFPRARPVPPKHGKAAPGAKPYWPGQEHYFIGSCLLRQEVRDELYETVARTVFEKEGVTWVDFDVFAEVCLEAWKRQMNMNVDIFEFVFAEFADQEVQAELRKSSFGSNLDMLSAGPSGYSELGVGIQIEEEEEEEEEEEDVGGSPGIARIEEEEKPPEKIMTREAFDKIIARVIPGVLVEKIDEMWQFLDAHRLSEGMDQTITKDHFALLMTRYGIMPPAHHMQPLGEDGEIGGTATQGGGGEHAGSAGAGGAFPNDGVGGGGEGAAEGGDADAGVASKKSTAGKLFGSLGIAMRLKKIAHRIHDQVNELSHFSVLCQTGQLDEVKAHLEDADLDERSERGSTPMMHATWFGYAEVVDFLIHNGANVNLHNNRGNTALHFAYENNHVKIIKVCADFDDVLCCSVVAVVAVVVVVVVVGLLLELLG